MLLCVVVEDIVDGLANGSCEDGDEIGRVLVDPVDPRVVFEDDDDRETAVEKRDVVVDETFAKLHCALAS
jgi:hypothetical protein